MFICDSQVQSLSWSFFAHQDHFFCSFLCWNSVSIITRLLLQQKFSNPFPFSFSSLSLNLLIAPAQKFQYVSSFTLHLWSPTASLVLKLLVLLSEDCYKISLFFPWAHILVLSWLHRIWFAFSVQRVICLNAIRAWLAFSFSINVTPCWCPPSSLPSVNILCSSW